MKTIAPIPMPAVGIWNSKKWNPEDRSTADEVFLSVEAAAPMFIVVVTAKTGDELSRCSVQACSYTSQSVA
jgi:hypothetical protein